MTKAYPEWMGKMRGLTAAEISTFLQGSVIARLATVAPDGTPYVVPVWQEWDGAHLYIIGRLRSLYVAHIKINSRVAVSCAIDTSPYTRVQFRGTAEIAEGPAPMQGAMLEMARRMARRYLGERGPDYLEPTVPRPRYLIRVTPSETISWEGVEWHEKYTDAAS